MRSVPISSFAMLALMVAGCAPPPEPADLILTGGTVVTVDEDNPSAEAVAIRGAKIQAVGSHDEIAALAGPGTEVVELGGRLVVPGFVEGHGHFMSLGRAQMILDLTTAESWDEIVEQVRAATAEAGPDEWILGRGWHQEKWSSPPVPAVEGNPVHAALSEASPENPVYLIHASGHASFVNARAMELVGIDAATPDPPGGELVRDEQGAPTGVLREAAQRLVSAAIERARSEMTPEELEIERRRQVELAGEEALANGVTSFHDAGVGFDTIDFLRRLEAEGVLPIRLYAMVRFASNDEMAEKLPLYRSPAEENDFLVVRSIKRQIDGALGAHGAWLLEPYADLPTSTGLVLEPEEEIRRTAELAIEHGYQLNTHAIGDKANRRVLDIYAEAFAAAGAEDHRWRIEHAQHLHPDDVDRFVELDVIASMQGVHCTSDAPWVLKRLGAERAESGAYVWRSLLDRGVVINNGTDVPVEDIDPIASFYSTVTRKTATGEAFYPAQVMTREEALHSYTLAGAYAAFEEDVKGSLEAGKLADVVVLSKNILTVPDDEIRDAVVDLTIVGGEVRYRRAAVSSP